MPAERVRTSIVISEHRFCSLEAELLLPDNVIGQQFGDATVPCQCRPPLFIYYLTDANGCRVAKVVGMGDYPALRRKPVHGLGGRLHVDYSRFLKTLLLSQEEVS